MGKNTAINTGVSVVSMGLDMAKYTKSSFLIQPAVWVLTGDTGDTVDKGLYAGGVISSLIGSTIGGVAFALTSIWKGYVDDHDLKLLKAAQASEPLKYQPFIKSCYKYGSSGPAINASTIASKGGTAWLHPAGTWVYIVDARGRFVCDYQPKVAKTIYSPILPLQPVGNNRFRWRYRRG